jgi:hypothetical protein
MAILMREVLAEVNKPNVRFSIGYYKNDGSYSEKQNVVNRSKNLSDRKLMSTIDLIMKFNGNQIIREE